MRKVFRQYAVVFSIVLSVSFLAQTTQSEKIDPIQFLENIKQPIKTRMLELKTRKSKRKDKSEILKQKIKTRKKLIEKLSNPFLLFRKPEHYIINVKGQKSKSAGPSRKVRLPSAVVKSAGQKSKVSEDDLTLNKSQNFQISQFINRILKENPLLVPFKLPDLKQFFERSGDLEVSNSQIGNSKDGGLCGMKHDVSKTICYNHVSLNEMGQCFNREL